MKEDVYKKRNGARGLLRVLVVLFVAVLSAMSIYAQNSLPAPGTGGSFRPNPIGSGMPGPVIPSPSMPGYRPGLGAGCGPGWGPGWTNYPSAPIPSPSWTNQGETNVIACGYDATGVWRTIPMRVAYVYNGVDYDVTVLAAYNPWTDMWNRGLNVAAYNTNYYLRGVYYDFYTVLSTGTFYFNL